MLIKFRLLCSEMQNILHRAAEGGQLEVGFILYFFFFGGGGLTLKF